MKHKVRGTVAVKPNLVDCAPHACEDPVNWCPSQNPLAEDNNSAKNLDRSLPSVVWGISRCDLSYPKSQATHPPRSMFSAAGSRRRMNNILFQLDAPHLKDNVRTDSLHPQKRWGSIHCTKTESSSACLWC